MHDRRQSQGSHFRGSPDRVVETLVARLALMLAQPLGGALIQPVLDVMMATLRRRHPNGFERLAELGESALLIEPADLPSTFLLQVGTRPSLRVCRGKGGETARARIRGNFAVLLDLFEGRIDGDALFFSRELTIEGDTELVVGLRNALDGEDFDLVADFGAVFGPLSALPLRQPLQRLAGVLVDLHQVLLAPAFQRLEQVERRLGRLEEGKR